MKTNVSVVSINTSSKQDQCKHCVLFRQMAFTLLSLTRSKSFFLISAMPILIRFTQYEKTGQLFLHQRFRNYFFFKLVHQELYRKEKVQLFS